MEQIATFITAATFTGTTPITLISTDAGATVQPMLKLYRNSSTPAASDIIGSLILQGEDSAGNTEDYADIYSQIIDATSTSEDASTFFRTKIAGTITTILTLSSAGLTVGTGLILPQASAPAPTAEGDMRWDTDDNVLAVGDGAATKTIAPVKVETIQSASGSAVTFTSIPSYVRQCTVSLFGLSTNGTAALLVQLGDAGGVETTGYTSDSTGMSGGALAVTDYTTGIGIRYTSAAHTVTGSIVFTLIDPSTFTWVAQGVMNDAGSAAMWISAGSKSTSAQTDRFSVVTTDTYDAGSVGVTCH